MTTYARIQNNIAVEVFVAPTGFTINDCFHAEVVALFTVITDGTVTGSTLENGEWVAPPVQPDPTPAPTVYPTISPMEFYLSFKTSERMKLKALATTGLPANSAFNATATAIPVDPIIEEFWATYQMAVQSNAHIDPNLASIQEALEYLTSPTAPTPPVITTARIAQILQGIAQ